MRYDLEGELAAPDPRVVWACPSCRRRVVDELGRRTGLVCAGDPLTGASHTPAAMTRTPERPTPAELEVLPKLAAVIPFRRRVVSLDELAAMVAADKAHPRNYCPTCGPLVEVDNPVRRDVRHRRGCPTQEA